MSAYRDGAPKRNDTPAEANARAALGAYLEKGEDFAWLGHPRRASWLRGIAQTIPVLVLGPIFALEAHGGLLVILVATAVIAFAILAFNRFLVEGARGDVFYGLTSKRVLVFDAARSPQFFAYDLARLENVYLMDTSWDGSGTLHLAEPGNEHPPLVEIAGAAAVYMRIIAARDERKVLAP